MAQKLLILLLSLYVETYHIIPYCIMHFIDHGAGGARVGHCGATS